MSANISLQRRLGQLHKLKQDIPGIIRETMETATNAAITAAAEATPPKTGTGRGIAIGTNTTSGQLKGAWQRDSKPTPEQRGNEFVTELNNNQEYASYVNDGHRMDRHFVPHLYINPDSGLLEYDERMDVGIVVGTKTKYVKGEFMVDKAKKAFEDTITAELDKKISEAME